MECITHHNACDCREAKFRELEHKVEQLEARLAIDCHCEPNETCGTCEDRKLLESIAYQKGIEDYKKMVKRKHE